MPRQSLLKQGDITPGESMVGISPAPINPLHKDKKEELYGEPDILQKITNKIRKSSRLQLLVALGVIAIIVFGYMASKKGRNEEPRGPIVNYGLGEGNDLTIQCALETATDAITTPWSHNLWAAENCDLPELQQLQDIIANDGSVKEIMGAATQIRNDIIAKARKAGKTPFPQDPAWIARNNHDGTYAFSIDGKTY